MLDAALYFIWPDAMSDQTFVGDFTPGRIGVRTQGLTQVSDGYVVYMAISAKQRQALLRAVGRADLLEDPRFATPNELLKWENLAILDQVVADAALEITKDDFLKRLGEAGIPCGPILEPREVVEDGHVRAEELLTEWEDPVAGRVRSPRPPLRFSETQVESPSELRPLGEDGVALLRALGWTEERLSSMVAGGQLHPGSGAQR